MGFFSFLRRLFSRRKPDTTKLVPRVRVLDNELNRKNEHWKALIGQEGFFLGRQVDDEGEIWDVKLDSQPVPHSHIMAARFQFV